MKEEQTTHSEGLEIESQTPSLLPCPFCGGDAEIEPYGMKEHSLYAVRCSKCNMVTGNLVIEEKAVIAWNTRAEDTAALRQRIAELENKTEYVLALRRRT